MLYFVWTPTISFQCRFYICSKLAFMPGLCKFSVGHIADYHIKRTMDVSVLIDTSMAFYLLWIIRYIGTFTVKFPPNNPPRPFCFASNKPASEVPIIPVTRPPCAIYHNICWCVLIFKYYEYICIPNYEKEDEKDTLIKVKKNTPTTLWNVVGVVFL